MKVYKFNDYSVDTRIVEHIGDKDGVLWDNVALLREYLSDLTALSGNIRSDVTFNVEIDDDYVSLRDISLDCKNAILIYKLSIVYKSSGGGRDIEYIKDLQNLGKLSLEVETIFGYLKREKAFSKYKLSLEVDSLFVMSPAKDYEMCILLENEEFLTVDEIVELNDAYTIELERLLDIENRKLNNGFEFIYNEDEKDEDFITIGLSNAADGLLDAVGGYENGVLNIDWDDVEAIILNNS